MAGIQRKLVHKQFNSPMGLYSQENVKATLNRELKAFGADGIEIDEQITKPLNLANSAVLRAVEEEEQQVKCGDYLPQSRQSRSRQREGEAAAAELVPHHALHHQLLDQIKTQYLSHQHDVCIDRDTVLRINRMSTRRHLLKRDHSWPPVEPSATAAAETVPEVPTKLPAPMHSHSIEALREKFSSPTRLETENKKKSQQPQSQLQSQQRPRTPLLTEEALSCFQHHQQQQQQQQQKDNRQTPQTKGFSAPETKAADADIGLVAPKCEYYEQLIKKRPATPTLKSSTPYRPRLKRQSYSLDRGRARKRAVVQAAATELPPPKPRNGNGSGAVGGTSSGTGSGAVGGTSSETSSGTSRGTGSRTSSGTGSGVGSGTVTGTVSGTVSGTGRSTGSGTLSGTLSGTVCGTVSGVGSGHTQGSGGIARVQRRSIKLATELKICYDTDTDMANDGDSEEEPKANLSLSGDIDLETVPLPAPPSAASGRAVTAAVALPKMVSTVIDSLAVKQQQQLALALATTTTSAPPPDCERIIPVAVSVETASQLHPGQLEARVQQIYDDACSYLCQDQEQHNMSPPPAHAEEQGTVAQATYVSATSGIKLQRQDSANKYQRQLSSSSASNSSCIPTPPPLPPPPPPPFRLRGKGSTTQDTAADRAARRQGIVYNSSCNPETPAALAAQHEAHLEIAQLEAKYAHIQQSITEHLRQIDAYMENAKTALQRSVKATPAPAPEPPKPTPEPATPLAPQHSELWDMFASRQSPILAVESPLQAILRQIYCRAAGIQLQPKDQDISEPCPGPEMPAENVPIVERALEDLHKIAVALDSDEHALLLHVEHKTTPSAVRAEHVVIEEEEEQEKEQDVEQQKTALHVEDVEEEFNLDYKHVSDVIANYEQLSTGKETVKEKSLKTEELQLDKGKKELEHKQLQPKESAADAEKAKQESQEQEQQQQLLTTHQEKDEQEAVETSSCTHEPADDNLGSWCAICGECRESPHGWGKLNKADQWRLDNLHNEPLANYKSTYEIRSPYISRQISWEETQQPPQLTKPELLRQRSEIEIVTTAARAEEADAATPTPTPLPLSLAADSSKEWQLSRSPSPLPLRKYPAPLIDTAQRCSSPFGLNAVQAKATPKSTTTTTSNTTSTITTTTAVDARYTHVPQLEGHNIGLLVRTATEPLQLCMSASSSMLAATPPATPRCNSQPPPFEFLMQHGVGPQTDFKSIAASEELPQSTREFSVNRSFDNVSPRPYIGIEGYKRVAWPPASEERIVREFTPQPQQTLSPAPGSGGYYPQSSTASGNAAAAPPQGPIYNNVQPRTQQQQQLPPQQQHYQPQSAPNVYGPSTNYASNGYAPAATVAAPPATATQDPANNYNYPQQPIQYTQAQFNRQPSREPQQYPQQQQQQQQQQQPLQQQQPPQQQQHYQQSAYQQQQPPLQAVDNVVGGWKHIGAPQAKTHNDFTAGGVAPASAYPSYQQQQYPHQQQPYQAPSSDSYQQPAPQHWQQQQQQQQQPPQAQLPYQTSPYQQQQQQPQQQQHNYPQQNGGANYAQPQYNSYSQPQQLQPQQQQQLPYSQDQTDQQQSYRGASPGIITLRKETPVSQSPAPVYTSQPAAVSYQGGSKLRGDLKWPPPEYKEAAVRENEERRLLALGPVCRPRRVNRDYTPFFAKNQLNCTYPSYKVPPGTQHMFA